MGEVWNDHGKANLANAALRELGEHNRLMGRIVTHLAYIAEALPIPFVPATPEEQHRQHNRREQQFRKALQIVRDVLDCKGDVEPGHALPVDTRKRLFDVEALLSAELGQPVWEGRRA